MDFAKSPEVRLRGRNSGESHYRKCRPLWLAPKRLEKSQRLRDKAASPLALAAKETRLHLVFLVGALLLTYPSSLPSPREFGRMTFHLYQTLSEFAGRGVGGEGEGLLVSTF